MRPLLYQITWCLHSKPTTRYNLRKCYSYNGLQVNMSIILIITFILKSAPIPQELQFLGYMMLTQCVWPKNLSCFMRFENRRITATSQNMQWPQTQPSSRIASPSRSSTVILYYFMPFHVAFVTDILHLHLHASRCLVVAWCARFHQQIQCSILWPQLAAANVPSA